MGERWVTLFLFKDEILRCDQCLKQIKKQRVHLYLDVDDVLVETLCDDCWKREQKRRVVING